MNNKTKPLPVQVFLDWIEKWLTAVQGCNEADAYFHAEQLRVVGQLLSHDPEFKKIFQDHHSHCTDERPEHVVQCIHAFFQAVTHAGCSGKYRQSISNGGPANGNGKDVAPQPSTES